MVGGGAEVVRGKEERKVWDAQEPPGSPGRKRRAVDLSFAQTKQGNKELAKPHLQIRRPVIPVLPPLD